METDGEQNQQGAPTNGSTASGTSSRPSPMNSMSLYERQAVQALQALQRQPNAAQYFQQLMLQQQINNAQLQNLAAVQQVKVNSVHKHLSENEKEDSQSDNDQVQNLAMRGVSSPKGVGVKTEAPERSDSGTYTQTHKGSTPQSPVKPSQPQPQPPHIKIPTYPQPTNLKAHPSSSSAASSSSSSSTSSIPLSQLLLHGTRTLTTGTTAPTAAHTLVLTSNAASHPHGYPVGTATIKPAVNAQTLVVQPLQKTSLSADKPGHGNGPIPIQPKTLQGLRLPLQLPSRNPPPILPAPPPASSSAQPAPPPQPPHIPVQIVGARQSTLGNAQALALARSGCSQDGAAVLTSSSSLLTMVASIASREGGVMGRGVGLKALQSPQEAPPLAQVSQVHPQANQSSGQSQNGPIAPSPAPSQSPSLSSPPSSLSRSSLSLPLATEEQRGASATPPCPSPVLSISRQGEKAPPPQAVVKPHVLTHLIEGFVIQEGAEPFPVCGSVKDSTVLKCEYCKNFAPASQFRGTKRFCSMSCAKRYNVSFRQHFCVRQAHGQGPGQDQTSDQDQGQDHLSNSDEEGGIARRRVPRRTSSEIASAKIAGRPIPVKCRSESSHSEEESSGEEDDDEPMSLSPASSASCHQPPPPLPTESSAPGCLSAVPAQWSVEEVSQFISSLQGCEELAAQFLSQEIDGQALLLLKEEHLMSTMNIKLGPALKICAHINNLRD
uniref:Polyhomeotic homolog 1 n=1 Tax=Echeneis naucrates TaxID=173247 RepID=A0A665TXQ8_ECHNA